MRKRILSLLMTVAITLTFSMPMSVFAASASLTLEEAKWTAEAVDLFIEHKQLFAPGKAVNAGGVATSGLEMTQNAMHISWTAEEVDARLHQIMGAIHEQCLAHGKDGNYVNYVKGANIAGFMKVAKAMMAQGIV